MRAIHQFEEWTMENFNKYHKKKPTQEEVDDANRMAEHND